MRVLDVNGGELVVGLGRFPGPAVHRALIPGCGSDHGHYAPSFGLPDLLRDHTRLHLKFVFEVPGFKDSEPRHDLLHVLVRAPFGRRGAVFRQGYAQETRSVFHRSKGVANSLLIHAEHLFTSRSLRAWAQTATATVSHVLVSNLMLGDSLCQCLSELGRLKSFREWDAEAVGIKQLVPVHPSKDRDRCRLSPAFFYGPNLAAFFGFHACPDLTLFNQGGDDG